MSAALDQTFAAAVACHQRGDLDQAQALYSNVLDQDAGHVDSLRNLGAIMFGRGQYEIAAGLYRVVQQLCPQDAEAAYNRGCCLHQTGDMDAAAEHYARCLTLTGCSHIAALDNLIAIELERAPATARTIELIESRLALEEDVEKRLQLGEQCVAAQRADDADAHYRLALRTNPESPVALYQVTTQQLCRDPFADSSALAVRWHIEGFAAKNPPRPIPLPQWHGEELSGRNLFVATEQGVGDMVMFASRFNQIDAEQVTMEVDARMQSTFEHSFPTISWLPAPKSSMVVPDVDWQQFDAWSYAGDLFYRTDCEAESGGWLVPIEDKARRWERWLSQFDGLRVGVSWRGGSAASKTATHSLSASRFAKLIDGLPATFVLLQYNATDEELACFGDNLKVPDLDIREALDDVIALTSKLDVVITVDNLNVSIAAAVDTPAWTLLPLASDWRWRAKAPLDAWRQQVHPFSASEQGWEPALERLRQSLEKEIEERVPHERAHQASRSSRPVPVREKVRIPQTRQSNAIVVNDALSSNDFGESVASLGLYDMLGRKGHTMTSLPDYALAGIEVAEKPFEPEALEAFWSEQAAVLDALSAADEVYLVPSMDPARAVLLRYLGVIADQHFNKRVHMCDFLPEMMRAGIGRIGAPSNENSTPEVVCTLSSFISPEAASRLVTSLEGLNEPVTLLLGGRAKMSREQLAVAQFLTQSDKLDVNIRWVHHEAEWLAAVVGAERLVTTSTFAEQVRRLTSTEQVRRLDQDL